MNWEGILFTGGPLSGDRVGVGLTKMDEGSAMVDDAISATSRFSLPGVLERQARQGLELLCSALNWLEDTEYFDEAHRAMDAAGLKVRQTFGCKLTFDKASGYSRACPVDLAHTRVGISIEAVIEQAYCSICERSTDDEDCLHVTGQVYDGEKCLEIITKAEMKSANIVARPKMPDARLTSLSVSTEDLQAELGESFRSGMKVNCDKCLQGCPGVKELPPSGHA